MIRSVLERHFLPLGSGPDLLARLRAHGLLPVAARALQDSPPPGLPADTLNQLLAAARQSAASALMHCAELAAITSRFATLGLHPLAFKGPALATLAYGSPCLRVCADLDLLLPDNEIPAAAAALAALGYLPAGQSRPGIHLSFRHAALPVTVELQAGLQSRWNLAPHPPLDFSFPSLWTRRQPLTLHGRTLLTFGPEHTLLALSIHPARHRWAEFRWILDLASYLAAQPRLDWPALLHAAPHLHCARRLSVAFALVQQAFNPDALPSPARLCLAADPLASTLAASFYQRLWSPPPHGLRSRWASLSLLARLRDTPAERARDHCGQLLSLLAPS